MQPPEANKARPPVLLMLGCVMLGGLVFAAGLTSNQEQGIDPVLPTVHIILGCFSVVAFLLYIRWCRIQRPQEDLERQWEGHGIEATNVLRRVTSVRRDYVHERLSPPAAQARRRGLVGSARDAILHLAYFRHRRSTPIDPTDERVH